MLKKKRKEEKQHRSASGLEQTYMPEGQTATLLLSCTTLIDDTCSGNKARQREK